MPRDLSEPMKSRYGIVVVNSRVPPLRWRVGKHLFSLDTLGQYQAITDIKIVKCPSQTNLIWKRLWGSPMKMRIVNFAQ